MPATAIAAIKILVLPPASLIILALVGLFFHKRRFGIVLSVMALLGLLLSSLPIVTGTLAGFWERFPPLQPSHVAEFQPQAVVVIGGGVKHNASEYQAPLTVHPRTLLRLRYAAKIAREYDLPILVSGGVVEDMNVSEAQLMAQVLEQEFNVFVTWQEQDSRNTAENAQFTRDLLIKQGVTDIILVTQAYHMPRAISEFRKSGFNVLPAPTDFIRPSSEALSDLKFSDFIPSSTALTESFLLAHESLGMLWYAIRY